MKEKNVKLRRTTKEVKKIPTVKFASDWFKCRNCGYTVMKRVLGNIATCSECGGTMDRI